MGLTQIRVDPDNVDGYDNDNGLKLTEKDAIEYMEFLSTEAHHRNLSIGLKNAGSIVKDVVKLVEWSVQPVYTIRRMQGLSTFYQS